MPFLPSLIKRVDEFFKVAQTFSLVSLGADDKALLAELAKAAQEAVNPELSYNLRILAAMYAKALEISGGFHTVYMALSSIIEDIDPDEEESEPVENLLNQIGSSIKSRAQRPDSPGDVRELQMAATAARGEDTPYNYEEPEEGDDDVSAYEASLLGYDGGQKAFEEEGGVSQFDMTGGVNPEAAQSGTGRGYSVGKAHSYKDWAAIYANEREKYERDLNGPAELLTPSARAGRKDPRVQANLSSLVDVLGKLSVLTMEALKISNQIALETEVPHPEEEARLQKIREELSKLERERRLLKRNLNKFYKSSEADTLREKINQPGVSSQEKRILEQKLKLQELRTSGKYGYGREAKERVKLIDALTADPNLSPEQFKKMEESINGAAQFTDRMTKAQYDRIRTVQKTREQEGREAPTAAPMRGGGRVKKPQIDFDTASYPALLKRFRELNNTITSDAKKYVARSGKEKGDDRMQPYVEAVSTAIRKKDQAAKFAAINALKAAIKETLVSDASLRGYLWSIRLAPHFKAIEEFLYNIKTKQDATGAWNLSEGERDTLRQAASQIQRMYDIYTRFFPEKGGRYGRSHYMTSVKFYPSLIKYIYDNILQEEQPSLETTAQNIPGGFKSMQDWLDTKRKYDRERFEEQAKQEGRIVPPPAQSFRGGPRPQTDRDLSKLTTVGLAKAFGTSINTASNTIRDYVAHPKAKGDSSLKPYVTALSDAIIKGDKQAKYLAIKELQTAIQLTTVRDGALRQLLKYYRLVPHLYKLRDAIGDITSPENAKNFVDQAERILSIYKQHFYKKSFIDDKVFTTLDKPMLVLANIVNQFKGQIS